MHSIQERQHSSVTDCMLLYVKQLKTKTLTVKDRDFEEERLQLQFWMSQIIVQTAANQELLVRCTVVSSISFGEKMLFLNVQSIRPSIVHCPIQT